MKNTNRPAKAGLFDKTQPSPYTLVVYPFCEKYPDSLGITLMCDNGVIQIDEQNGSL